MAGEWGAQEVGAPDGAGVCSTCGKCSVSPDTQTPRQHWFGWSAGKAFSAPDSQRRGFPSAVLSVLPVLLRENSGCWARTASAGGVSSEDGGPLLDFHCGYFCARCVFLENVTTFSIQRIL